MQTRGIQTSHKHTHAKKKYRNERREKNKFCPIFESIAMCVWMMHQFQNVMRIQWNEAAAAAAYIISSSLSVSLARAHSQSKHIIIIFTCEIKFYCVYFKGRGFYVLPILRFADARRPIRSDSNEAKIRKYTLAFSVKTISRTQRCAQSKCRARFRIPAEKKKKKNREEENGKPRNRKCFARDERL